MLYASRGVMCCYPHGGQGSKFWAEHLLQIQPVLVHVPASAREVCDHKVLEAAEWPGGALDFLCASDSASPPGTVRRSYACRALDSGSSCSTRWQSVLRILSKATSQGTRSDPRLQTNVCAGHHLMTTVLHAVTVHALETLLGSPLLCSRPCFWLTWRAATEPRATKLQAFVAAESRLFPRRAPLRDMIAQSRGARRESGQTKG